MKTHKRTANQAKILKAMDKVYEYLIKFKKEKNSVLVILKDDKIVYVKP
jgi:hypothetical protein